MPVLLVLLRLRIFCRPRVDDDSAACLYCTCVSRVVQVVQAALKTFAASLEARDAAAAAATASTAPTVTAVQAAAQMERTASSEAKLAHVAAFKEQNDAAAQIAEVKAKIAALKAGGGGR